MFFSISNLTIIYITVVVIFFNGYSDGSIETCQDELNNLKFNKRHSPLSNLTTIFKDKLKMVKNPKRSLKKKTDLKEYKLLAEKTIGLTFNEEHIDGYNNLIYGPRYILHLKEHILETENMLSVVTWCDLNVTTKEEISEYVNGESVANFINEDKYKKYYVKRIANNTNLPRKNRLAAFKQFTVCLKEIESGRSRSYKKTSYDSITASNSYADKFSEDKQKIKDLKPLIWCATRVCYDSFIKSGFKDVTVEENIDLILPKKKLTETRDGRYGFHFYEYLRKVKEKDENYPIVSPYDSRIFIRYGYLRNWCSVQVCYDDLKAAGFIYWHASDNYYYVYLSYDGQSTPNVQHSENGSYPQYSSEYVIAYCEHLKFIEDINIQTYMGAGNVHPSLKSPENAEPRSPEDFCIFYILKIDESYYSYIQK